MAVAVRFRSVYAKCLFIGLVRSFSPQSLDGSIKNALICGVCLRKWHTYVSRISGIMVVAREKSRYVNYSSKFNQTALLFNQKMNSKFSNHNLENAK